MNKGMTLIEVIIAIALLAIITMVMLTVFGTTIMGIYNFGHDTETVFDDMGSLDEAIAIESGGSDVILDATDSYMVFIFENAAGDEFNVSITGNMYKTNNLNLEYFMKKE
ncbi:MAG: prepilin-type N-terminal cleavage/methylation domain-containing protein [Clostridiales bacterium]|nr:prepilin-type N-terminal cleavage/methylation domain-containing protein [Clostridiales bacterium]